MKKVLFVIRFQNSILCVFYDNEMKYAMQKTSVVANK